MSHKYENRTRRIEIKKSLIPSTRKYGSSQENDIVTFRPTYLEPRFVRPSFIVVFKTPLPRYRTQRRKDFLFVLSGREGRMQSNPRIDHPWLYTGNRAPRRNSRPAVISRLSFIRGPRYDHSLEIIQTKEGEGWRTKSSRDNQFSSAVRFSICIMFLLFETFHWM